MNRIAFFFAVLALALSLQAGPAAAQDEPSASHLEVAREVVTGSGMGRTFNEMVTDGATQRARSDAVHPSDDRDAR